MNVKNEQRLNARLTGDFFCLIKTKEPKNNANKLPKNGKRE